ncbi:MAG: hypothetical protein OXJ90_22970, partial [Spirochaetaceae bacterium]|nr:hypothetical protein [Spirochaetaceae bacterium]
MAAGLMAPVPTASAGAQPPMVDYDADDDGLIEVSSLSQLNAIRWDLDGDGTADVYPPSKDGITGHDPDGAVKLAAAFPSALAGMGCPTDGCDGYELAADLDFDTNGNGRADSGDEFWNEGKGWVPLMGGEAIYGYAQDDRLADRFRSDALGSRPHARARMFTGDFEGNGRTIANLYIKDAKRWYVGLFGYIGPGAHVRNLGLTAPNSDSGVKGYDQVGALAGALERGHVSGVRSDVDVAGHSSAGGLIGWNFEYGFVIESYATGAVAGSHWVGGLIGLLAAASIAAVYATGDVTASHSAAGGLVGYRVFGHIRATYAAGAVTVTRIDDARYTPSRGYPPPRVGGLIGWLSHPWEFAWMRANYASGNVSGSVAEVVGGLTGGCANSKRPRSDGSNYWDVETSGQATSPECGVGYTTAELQAPTDYTGIYADWNVDVHVNDYDGPFDGLVGKILVAKTSASHPREADATEAARDDPWDFGSSSEYPVLKYC